MPWDVRGRVMGFVVVLATSACAAQREIPDPSLPAPSSSVAANSSATPNVSATGTSLPPLSPPPAMDEDDLRFSCGSPLIFSAAALGAPGGAELADHPAAEALRGLLNDELLPQRPGWKIVVLDESAALFLLPARPAEGFAYWSAEFERQDSNWTYVRSSQCDIRPTFEGIGPAHWELAPGESLARTTQTIDVLVTELECASGQSPDERIVPAAILYYEDSVVVVFGVTPLPGFQTCEGGPPAEIELDLGEPLDERELMDGGVFPPESRGGAS